MREIAEPGDRRIVLRDETWLQTRLSLDAVKTLDSNLRLSRNDGDIQIVTYHKPSDPLSAGDHGSQAAQIAKDLLHLADIRVLLGQDHEVAAELGGLLGLTPLQQDIVTSWAMHDKAEPCGWSATTPSRCSPSSPRSNATSPTPTTPSPPRATPDERRTRAG